MTQLLFNNPDHQPCISDSVQQLFSVSVFLNLHNLIAAPRATELSRFGTQRPRSVSTHSSPWEAQPEATSTSTVSTWCPGTWTRWWSATEPTAWSSWTCRARSCGPSPRVRGMAGTSSAAPSPPAASGCIVLARTSSSTASPQPPVNSRGHSMWVIIKNSECWIIEVEWTSLLDSWEGCYRTDPPSTSEPPGDIQRGRPPENLETLNAYICPLGKCNFIYYVFVTCCSLTS